MKPTCKSGTRLYEIWRGMKKRCEVASSKDQKNNKQFYRLREKTMRILAFLFFALIPASALCDTDARLVRCEPFRATVVKVLKENGIPERFYFLMVAESGCRSKDVRSHRGAVGFWQMMPATGRAHGCDNLEDLECATKAAASYLKDLSTRFKGDDIIAAWNQGGHNLKRNGMTPEARELIRRVKYLEGIDKGG